MDENGQPKDGRQIEFAADSDGGPVKDNDTTEPFAVPAHEYFVMGDNRANSSDSRSFKGVERDEIIGKAFVLIWPVPRFTGL